MKRVMAFLLSILMLLTGCGQVQSQTTVASESVAAVEPTEPAESTAEPAVSDEIVPQYDSLDDDQLLYYVEDAVYTELVQTLDPEMFHVEGVETTYVSKEYLEEVEYNSQSNIFFGYSLADLIAQFQGNRYVFTLDEDGNTCVQELTEIEDEAYNKIVKNVAIGGGVILVGVTVVLLAENPAVVATTGKTVKIIFSTTVKDAKKNELLSKGISCIAKVMIEAIQTGDTKKALEDGLVSTIEEIISANAAFKGGAIFGIIDGIANGIADNNLTN